MMPKVKSSPRLLIVLWITCTLLWTSAVQANDGEREARARELMAEGLQAQKSEDYPSARTAYQRSFEVYPSYDVAGNLGLVEVQLREYPSAANHLAYCLRHFPTGANRELKKLVEENLTKAKQYVAEVTFEVNEPKAAVSVDGEAIGVSPFEHTVFVRAGHHIASAQLGEREVETPFTIERGRSGVVTLDFTKVLPSSGLDEPDGTNSVTYDDSSSAKKNWVPAYILGGVTVATFATSMVFRGMAGGQAKEVDRLRNDIDGSCVEGSSSQCAALKTAVDKHDGLGRVSNVTLVASGALAAATVGYVVYTLAKKPRTQRVSTSVDFNRNGGSLMFSGHF